MTARRFMAVLVVVLLGVAAPSRANESLATGIEAIRSHVTKFWKLPEGTRGTAHVIELAVETAKDGTVQSVTIKPPSLPPTPEWTQVALSARRAVFLASPLPSPAGKSQFKNFVLVFNTKT